MIQIQDIYCEGQTTQFGMPYPNPAFSWKISSDEDAMMQSAYQLRVSEDASGSDFIWDTGWIGSPASQNIRYEGGALTPETRYHFSVRIRSESGEESAWSAPGWFETSRDAGSWQGRFITREDLLDQDPSRPVYFQKSFDLDVIPDEARLYATALGIYEIRINGVPLNRHAFNPGWTDYDTRLQYQTFDAREYLSAGMNSITARVSPGWYAGILTWFHKNRLYGDYPALLADLILKFEDEVPLCISTDESWTAGYGPLQYAEIYHGERYDAREEEHPIKHADSCTSLSYPYSNLIPQIGPAVSVHERISGKKMITSPEGEMIIDFGQNLTGVVEFSLQAPTGTSIVIRHAEVLDREGNFYLDNIRGAMNRIEYTFKGDGTETFCASCTYQGFRYIRIEEYPYEINPEDFTALVLHSDMKQTLEFSCSHPLLNQLHSNILWGWKGNSLDIPSDCPQRDERLGWTGDAQVFIPTASYLMDVQGFFRKWVGDILSDQSENGAVPIVVPDVLSPLAHLNTDFPHPESSTGWGDAITVCPWTLYKRYGDIRILKESYEGVKRWISFMQERAEDGLLWKEGFHFGDWVALDAEEGSYFGATPNEYTASAYYAYSSRIAAEMAEVLDHTDDAQQYQQLSDRIIDAMRTEYFTADGTLKIQTQTAHVLALAFDIAEESWKEQLAEDLAAKIASNGGHLDTGFLGTPLITQALSDHGQSEAAYDLVLQESYPSWLYPIHQGATTIWEHWDGLKPDGTMWSPDMNSFNHYAYGSVGAWIYENIGCFDLDHSDMAKRTFSFLFNPGGGITSSEMKYSSIYGDVSTRWERLPDGSYELEITIPPNTSGRLTIEHGSIDGSKQVSFGSGRSQFHLT